MTHALPFMFSLALLLLPMLGCLAFHRGPLPGEPRDASFVDVAGARVRYVDTSANAEPSSRPAAVMLHGFASSLDAWTPVIPALAESHRVLALDLKGFGWSDRPAGDYSPEAQARLVLELLDRRGVQQTALVAHSWGCSVALAVALAAPERVSKLALYSAWVYEAQLPPAFYWARTEGVGEMMFGLYYKDSPDQRMALAFHDPVYVTAERVRGVASSLERPGTVAAALAAVRGQRFERLEKRYRAIDVPALLLWGAEDRITFLRYGERLAGDLPQGRLVTFPRCGHFPMIEAAEASNRELAAFLRA